MKKFLSILLALSQAFMLGTAVVAEEDETIEIIVELTHDVGGDAYSFAENCAKYADSHLVDFEYGYIYDTLLCGFSAELPASSVRLLEQLDFVKNVYYCAEYTALSSYDTDMLAAEMIGYAAAADAGLTGDGIKVAVIDSGFDVTHPAFDASVTETLDLTPFESEISVSRLNALVRFTDSSLLRYNSKIPLMYDYAYNDADVSTSSNHGTHVAGIIGAVSTEESDMHGIAPDCQLLLMKVFDDAGTVASDKALLAALEDAVKLGADVINLSLGHYAGSADPSRIVGLDNIIKKAEAQGSIIVCAAGNDGVTTERGSLNRDLELSYPPVTYTDYGTISAPATTDFALSVASVDNSVYYARFFRHAYNSKLAIDYTDTNVSAGVIEVPFTDYFDTQTLEYAVIPGIGEEKDYEGIDVAGKLALVSRGIIPFVDKVNIAAEKGAVGVIVYNNTEEEEINMDLTGAVLPAIAISLADGQALIAETHHALTFDSDYTWRERTDTVGLISSYSSYGATPSLTLKPDITAVGGSVYSTVVGGGYGGISGTSMAAPQISGICALLLEKAKSEGVTDPAASASGIKTALMNTAVPVVQKNGTEYSPRAQGAGLVDLAGALQRELEITYAANGKPKAELFDKLGGTVSFDVTLKNLTKTPIEVSLSATLAHDGYTELEYNGSSDFYNTLEAVADTRSEITCNESGRLNRHTADHTPLVFTLDGEEARTLTLTIKLDEGYHAALADIFTNGYFAEGFVICESENTSVSLPYMGYIGDWASAPVIDNDVYTSGVNAFGGTKFYTMLDGSYVQAGCDFFTEPYRYDIDSIAFSPDRNGYADEIYFGAVPLRNCRSATMTVTDSSGKVLCTSSTSYFSKTGGFDDPMLFRFYWDGGDGKHPRYKFPDGIYYLTFEYVLDYGENLTQSYTYPVIIDTVDPTVSSISLDGNKLSVTASDNSGIRMIGIYENDSEDSFKMLASSTDTAVFDIREYEGSTLYCEVIDYAYNVHILRVELSALDAAA